MRDGNFILLSKGHKFLYRLRPRITAEGEMYQDMIKGEPNTIQEPCIFFVWPLEVVHVLGQDSSFYSLSAADLAQERFELVAIMEGKSETSSMTFQAK